MRVRGALAQRRARIREHEGQGARYARTHAICGRGPSSVTYPLGDWAVLTTDSPLLLLPRPPLPLAPTPGCTTGHELQLLPVDLYRGGVTGGQLKTDWCYLNGKSELYARNTVGTDFFHASVF